MIKLTDKERAERIQELKGYFEKYPEQKPVSIHRVLNGSNDLELVFLSHFLRKHMADDSHLNTLDYVCNKGDLQRPVPASNDQISNALSVLQWIGSPVGFGFIRDVLEITEIK